MGKRRPQMIRLTLRYIELLRSILEGRKEKELRKI